MRLPAGFVKSQSRCAFLGSRAISVIRRKSVMGVPFCQLLCPILVPSGIHFLFNDLAYQQGNRLRFGIGQTYSFWTPCLTFESGSLSSTTTRILSLVCPRFSRTSGKSDQPTPENRASFP